MIALVTNILVYARRAETVQHGQAKAILKELAEGDQPWALPWPMHL
jgi:predicted nucleic acid-binding protein